MQGLVPRRFVLVPEPQPGIVEDGHQHVVELVGGRADELPEGCHLLRVRQLLLESGNLLGGGRRLGMGSEGHASPFFPGIVESN